MLVFVEWDRVKPSDGMAYTETIFTRAIGMYKNLPIDEVFTQVSNQSMRLWR